MTGGELLALAERKCASCQHMGVIYWDNGYSKTHHCMRSSERRRDNFKSSGDRADDFMCEFRKFYDATAGQKACRYHAEREPLDSDKLDILSAVDGAGRDGFVVKFFSRENSLCTQMSGKFVDGGSFAYPNEPARGNRRWFITDMGKAELSRSLATPINTVEEGES